jgi:hypothetical protein
MPRSIIAQVEGLGTPPKFALTAAFSSKKLDQVLGRSDCLWQP